MCPPPSTAVPSRNGVPGATPTPWLASRTTAAVSSCTGTQMLMPSLPGTSTPRRDSASTTRARRAAYVLDACTTWACASALVSSPSSTCCSNRLDQPWPSSRRAVIARCSAGGALRAARRRSGPCDFENDRMYAVCPGRQRPVLASEAEDRPAAESSSTTRVSVPSSSLLIARARFVVIVTPTGFWARGCRKMAATGSVRAACRAASSRPSVSTGTPTSCTPTDSSRSTSGGKPGFSSTTRSPNRSVERTMRSIASMAPSTTARSGAAYGQSERSTSARPGSTGSSR